MADGRYIREDLYQVLVRLAAKEKSGLFNNDAQHASPPNPSDEHFPADIYIAGVPPEGIPGRVGNVMGSGNCNVYQGNTDGTLDELSMFPMTVFNLSTEEITPDQEYIEVKREKYGIYITGGSSSSVSSGTLARISAVGTLALAGTGSGAEVYYYDWVEVSKDPISGIPFDVVGGQSGTYAEGTFAFELTDALVAIGTLVHIFQLANGVYWFEGGHTGERTTIADVTCEDGVFTKVQVYWTFVNGRLKAIAI